MTKQKRNPSWAREELILALDLFFRHDPRSINKNHEEVTKLSKILNSLTLHTDRPNQEVFRNNNGVYLKLNNLLRFDPTYNGVGMRNGGKLEEEIWNEFSSNKSYLRKKAEEIINDSLLKVLTDNDEIYQHQVESIDVPDDFDIDDKPKDKPSKNTNNKASSYDRDAKTAKKSIITAKYNCEIDCSHKDFNSKITGKNYVEAHHLIPMKYQDDFSNSIDVEANIISLCVICHKKTHHAKANIVTPLIESLYEERKNRLKDCGIYITKEYLLSCYK